MMEDVILESLLREHMIRFAQKEGAGAPVQDGGKDDDAHDEEKDRRRP